MRRRLGDEPRGRVDTLVAPSFFRPDLPPPGPGRSKPRRPVAVREAEAPAPAAGPPIGAQARSWPRRETCSQLIQHRLIPLLFNGCVLPPAHDGTCLPAPRKGR